MMGMPMRMFMSGEIPDPVSKAVAEAMAELVQRPEVRARIQELAASQLDAALQKQVGREVERAVEGLFGYGREGSEPLRTAAVAAFNRLMEPGSEMLLAVEAKVEGVVREKIESGRFVEAYVGDALTRKLADFLEKAVATVARRESSRAKRAVKKAK